MEYLWDAIGPEATAFLIAGNSFRVDFKVGAHGLKLAFHSLEATT
jgi:hypothetical protein